MVDCSLSLRRARDFAPARFFDKKNPLSILPQFAYHTKGYKRVSFT